MMESSPQDKDPKESWKEYFARMWKGVGDILVGSLKRPRKKQESTWKNRMEFWKDTGRGPVEETEMTRADKIDAAEEARQHIRNRQTPPHQQ
jgi:hypothetical protein